MGGGSEGLSGVGFFLSPLPEAGGGKGEGEELGVVAGPTHPHPDPPPSRGREKKGRFRKNLPQKGSEGEGARWSTGSKICTEQY